MICPCCGCKFDGDLRREACRACGAQAVGPALSPPARELPSHGDALTAGLSGAVLAIALTAVTLVALFERVGTSFELWQIAAAAESAAWRVKWLALLAAGPVLWLSARACNRIRREPARRAGLAVARAGFAMSILTLFSVALLIAVTVPERLRRREVARQAADNALMYTSHRILLAYKARYRSFPATPEELQARLPDDHDGSVARVVAAMKFGVYSPVTTVAAIPPASRKTRGGRRISSVRIRSVSERVSDDDMPEGIPLTNYELILPGRDDILGTPDDLRIRDGLMRGDASYPPGHRLRQQRQATSLANDGKPQRTRP